MDEWEYWLFEENINIVNELAEDEENHRKKQEGDQMSNMPNYNIDSTMKSVSGAMKNIPKM